MTTFQLNIQLDDSNVQDGYDVQDAVARLVEFNQFTTDNSGTILDRDGNTVGEWSFSEKVNVRGCSCGMADYDAEGHDGDLTPKRERLAELQVIFAASGGRGVDIAEEIDTLIAELEEHDEA